MNTPNCKQDERKNIRGERKKIAQPKILNKLNTSRGNSTKMSSLCTNNQKKTYKTTDQKGATYPVYTETQPG
jgi:hypothetical protein